jgi:hypothetical protein
MEQFTLGAGPTMKASELKKVNPEQLAARIRKLALDSHHAMRNPFVTAAKLDELSREIRDLRKAARAAYLSEIECWLHNVQRQVEKRLPVVHLTA